MLAAIHLQQHLRLWIALAQPPLPGCLPLAWAAQVRFPAQPPPRGHGQGDVMSLGQFFPEVAVVVVRILFPGQANHQGRYGRVKLVGRFAYPVAVGQTCRPRLPVGGQQASRLSQAQPQYLGCLLPGESPG